jgi:hypothetical protein
MSPGDIRLAGDPGPGRQGPEFFVGCPQCKWLEPRTDTVATCESGQHRALLMEVQYFCVVCKWKEWCEGPVVCNVSASHTLVAKDARPSR